MPRLKKYDQVQSLRSKRKVPFEILGFPEGGKKVTLRDVENGKEKIVARTTLASSYVQLDVQQHMSKPKPKPKQAKKLVKKKPVPAILDVTVASDTTSDVPARKAEVITPEEVAETPVSTIDEVVEPLINSELKTPSKLVIAPRENNGTFYGKPVISPGSITTTKLVNDAEEEKPTLSDKVFVGGAVFVIALIVTLVVLFIVGAGPFN